MAKELKNEKYSTQDAPAEVTDLMPEIKIVPHAGIVAVVGRTNSGKSTLMNRIIGEKISIVSPVVQTTLNIVRGILTDSRGQLVLIDTPGLHKSRSALGSLMNKKARSASEGADVVLLVIDGSRRPQLEDEGWFHRLVESEVTVITFLNKSDRGSMEQDYLDLYKEIITEKTMKGPPNFMWFKGSARTGEGVDELVSGIFKLLPSGPLLFDEDMLTDYPRKLAVADVIREKFFLTLHSELPHSIGVQVDEISENKKGKTIVRATVFVKRNSHKGIVIGSGGRNLKSIQKAAEKDLVEVLDSEVSVDIWIKVQENWDQNLSYLKQMGHL
ncbi:MAG: GTPase Era [Lentisphaerae bacterium]|jgi:GTP-binding protein Era|nr:GTPase Era [Lentisphaerota bacterium]